MPRTVDHDARRQDLVQALWQVVRRDGLAAVSVRSVAAQAGTSPGSLRHYFATQDELLAFALRSVVDRVTARLAPLPALSGREGAVRVLEQLVPLDVQRREETEVYLAFATRALVDPALRAVRDDAELLARQAVRHAVALLADAGALGDGRTVEQDADATYHLLDGLALHGTLWPERYPPAHLRAVLDAHVRRLAADLVA